MTAIVCHTGYVTSAEYWLDDGNRALAVLAGTGEPKIAAIVCPACGLLVPIGAEDGACPARGHRAGYLNIGAVIGTALALLTEQMKS